jgi:hypothetical protein
MTRNSLGRPLHVALAAIAAIIICAPLPASAASTSAAVKEAQTIMTKFDIPTGPIDGAYGPLTARGLCVARYMTGNKTPNRTTVTSNSDVLVKLRSWNKTYGSLQSMPAPKLDGRSTYLLVLQKCQAIIYAANGTYSRVMAASTGTNASQSNDGKDHRTPTGSYQLGYTDRTYPKNQPSHPTGWSCSTLYPEGCSHHPGAGINSVYSDYGNMYNKRHVTGAVFVHGSTSVPARPASHGCIRVTVADSDWMFKHVGNDAKPYVKIVGQY